jgi:DNA polymerase V
MTDLLALELVDKHIVTDQIVLTVEYDVSNLRDKQRMELYNGEIVSDHYGRLLPKSAHGSVNLSGYTSSTHKIIAAVSELYDRIVDSFLLVRKINIAANHIIPEDMLPPDDPVQLDFFTDFESEQQKRAAERLEQQKEHALQMAMLSIRKRYGKNAILKGMNFIDGATTRERNAQVGGHRA